MSRNSNFNAAKIIVADSGPGIPPENHQEIFDEFFTAPAPGVPAGTGLGLTIARELVEAHGGKIWVESMDRLRKPFLRAAAIFSAKATKIRLFCRL